MPLPALPNVVVVSIRASERKQLSEVVIPAVGDDVVLTNSRSTKFFAGSNMRQVTFSPRVHCLPEGVCVNALETLNKSVTHPGPGRFPRLICDFSPIPKTSRRI